MALLDRILRAGEGKKVKALADIIPDINAQEPEIHIIDNRRSSWGLSREGINRGKKTAE